MLLSDLLPASAIAVGVTAADKRAVFDRAGAIIGPPLGVSPRAVARTLADREALGSTGFGGGCAIPHGRMAGLTQMHAAVLRLAKPLDWQALDGLAVELVVVLLGPADAGVEHLKALALVSRLLRDRARVARMLGAADAGALLASLADGPDIVAA